jgi:hypothetical protein
VRAWARYAEWAADDAAAGGDSRRSLALAAALVRVARMEMAPPMISPFDGGVDLSERVERLLRMEPQTGRRPSCAPVFVGWAMAAGALAAVLQPATLVSVHKVLEHLIR